MKRLFSVLLAVVLAAPFAHAADKEKKKKSKKAVETTAPAKAAEDQRTGPAKMRAPTYEEDFEKSAEADKKRDEEIAHILKIVSNKQLPADQKADLIFRLAERYWEKSRFINMGEQRDFDKVYEAWSACVTKSGAEKCGAEPKLDTKKSDVYKKNALSGYDRLLNEYPRYERKDEVLFRLAYNSYDLGDKKTAIQQYWTLIKQFPKSIFVPDAYVQMGEYYFTTNELGKARVAYEKALEFEKNQKIYSFATYKLAWCDFNAGAYEGAIDKFQKVIAYSDKQAKLNAKAKDNIQQKNEALNDIVLSFSKVDAIDSAISYFQQNAGKERAHELVEKLARQYFNDGKFDPSIKVYRVLIAEDANAPDDPKYQQQIMYAFDKQNKRDKVKIEMETLVELYKPTSAWAKVNANNKSALAQAYDVTETAMRELVQDYHQEATKTKSVATYELAETIYKKYLENFPDSESSYTLRFYYAEILWALQKYDLAAIEYDKTVEKDVKGNFASKAAYDGILCYEKLVAIDKGQLKLQELKKEQKIDEKKSKGNIESRKQIVAAATKDDKESVLSEHEQKLVAACDNYLKVVPNSKDEITVKYKAAFVFYDHKRYVDAGQRFGEIILRWPGDQWSVKAADLILASLETKEEWNELNDLARKLHDNKKLSPAGSEFEKRVGHIIEGSQFKIVEGAYARANEKKDRGALAAVAKSYSDFVKEFPKSEYAPIVLYNSMLIYDNADELDNASAAAEHLLNGYPDADKGKSFNPSKDKEDPRLVPRVMLALADFAERTAQFDKAAQYFEMYVNKFEKEPKAPDQLFNAALYHEGLGEDAKAVADYQRYIKLYKTRTDLPDIALRIALMSERKKNWRETYDLLTAYLKDYGKQLPGFRRTTASYKRATALLQTGIKKDSDTAQEILDGIVKDYDALSAEDKQKGPVMDAVAHARFTQLESLFGKFIGVKFTSSKPQILAGELKDKAKLMGEVEAKYTEVLKYGSGTWGVAALCKIGEGYRNFSKSLLEAPMPKGLDEDQKEMYRSALEEKALPLEEKSVEAYEKALKKSFELAIYNDWTVRAEDVIREFKPDEFGESHALPYAGSEFFFTAAPQAALKPAASAGAGSD